MWQRVWDWAHISIVSEDDLHGYMISDAWCVICDSYLVFSSRELFGKVIYLWRCTVIASLFLAIIKKLYMIKSVYIFTKIGLAYSLISMIFSTTILRNTLTSFFSLKPRDVLVWIPFYYLQICLVKEHALKFFKLKVIPYRKTEFLHKVVNININIICDNYFHMTRISSDRKQTVCNIKSKLQYWVLGLVLVSWSWVLGL